MLSLAAPQESATWRSPAVAVSPGGALGGVVSTTTGATGVADTASALRRRVARGVDRRDPVAVAVPFVRPVSV